jgi:hypothetical protein
MKKHKSWHIKAAMGARQKMRVASKSVSDLSVKELGFHAMTNPSPRHQVALIAELVHRLDPAVVAPLLRSLPTEDRYEVKSKEPGAHHDTN